MARDHFRPVLNRISIGTQELPVALVSDLWKAHLTAQLVHHLTSSSFRIFETDVAPSFVLLPAAIYTESSESKVSRAYSVS